MQDSIFSQLCDTVQAKFIHNALAVFFNRLHAQVQRVGNLARGLPFRNKLQNFTRGGAQFIFRLLCFGFALCLLVGLVFLDLGANIRRTNS